MRLKDIVCALTGTEDVRVVITTTEPAKEAFAQFSDTQSTGEVKGVAIICDKELPLETKKEIISATSKILGVGSNHIFVGSSHIYETTNNGKG